MLKLEGNLKLTYFIQDGNSGLMISSILIFEMIAVIENFLCLISFFYENDETVPSN